MGYSQLELTLPHDYTEAGLNSAIAKTLKISDFKYEILKKSLDARKKGNIKWLLRIGVSSNEIKSGEKPEIEKLTFKYKKRNKKIIVVGSGPAGFFTGYTLCLSGFDVTIIEQGPDVEQRSKDIQDFEKTGQFKENSNYCFGEGGAGTFSDGKLTCRKKKNNLEKNFLFETLVSAGAPHEILYLNNPHIGSDVLQKVVTNLRHKFEQAGGQIVFNEKIIDLEVKDSNVISIKSANNKYNSDHFIFAPGHSCFDTYKMLLNNGVLFQNKPFAIGVRVEHNQHLINRTQFGKSTLEGVPSAEYKLTYKSPNNIPVYSFCMCPGGKIVPSSPTKNINIVNGASNYKRNGKFANSAIVAGIDLNKFLKKEISPIESLEWLNNIEKKAFDINNNYNAPFNKISDFLSNKISIEKPETSYPFGLFSYDFAELLPTEIITALRQGLKNFCNKMNGFETGNMIGIETKTSSPIQVIRDKETRLCENFENLYVIGEGSGFAGGIVSSAIDGIKTATSLLLPHQPHPPSS